MTQNDIRKIIRKTLLKESNFNNVTFDYILGIINEEISKEKPVKKSNKGSVMNESFSFDKFNQDLEARSDKITKENNEYEDNTPQRLYNEKYREDWRNTTRFK